VGAGNDGSFVLNHIERICRGYRLKNVQNPIVCKGPVAEEALARYAELGRTMAEGVNASLPIGLPTGTGQPVEVFTAP
jgi:hypothetical protein